MDIISKRLKSEPEPIQGETTPPDKSIKPVPPRNSRKEGDYYDVCPADGCLEVDRIHKMGGQMGDGKGAHEEYLSWSMFSADRRKGGCGALWANTTRQGQEHHDRIGMGRAKWLTRGAERTLSVPSDQFRDNYSAIFGHD